MKRISDPEAGQILSVIRRGLGAPYPLGLRRQDFFLSQKQLAEACGVSVSTVRRLEQGRLPSLHKGHCLLSFLADRARLFPEERLALFRRVWGGPPRSPGEGETAEMFLKGLMSVLLHMPFPAWVHDPFGDVLVANAEALKALKISRDAGKKTSPWHYNLWWHFTHMLTPRRLQEMLGALFRHLRVISLPFRARRYWAALCRDMYGRHPRMAPVIRLWQLLDKVDPDTQDIYLWGSHYYLRVFCLYGPAELVYLALCIPLSLPRKARGWGMEAYPLAPWSQKDKQQL